MLHLTHTLPVNQEKQAHLTREQLWQGLLLRIVEPTYFTVGLDKGEILERSDTHFRRALYFGEHIVHDTVTLFDQDEVEFVTEVTEAAPSGRLKISIQGNTGEDLRLLFTYTTQFPEPSNDEERSLLEMIKSAYIAADADMIRIIRGHALTVRH